MRIVFLCADSFKLVSSDIFLPSLQVDLRDGVRLTKLTELLTHDTSVRGGTMDLLRVPANSRLQKMHNVGLALKSLYGYLGPVSRGRSAGQCSTCESQTASTPRSVLHCSFLHNQLLSVGMKFNIFLRICSHLELDPDPCPSFLADSKLLIQGPEDHSQEARDIVDGQRDATLYLLWKILYACQLRNVRYDESIPYVGHPGGIEEEDLTFSLHFYSSLLIRQR